MHHQLNLVNQLNQVVVKTVLDLLGSNIMLTQQQAKGIVRIGDRTGDTGTTTTTTKPV